MMCNYCDPNSTDDGLYRNKNHRVSVDVVFDKLLIKLWGDEARDYGGLIDAVKIHYCPMCGGKLGEGTK